MVKRILIFKLKPGTDPEEFWDHWEKVHAAEFRKRPELKKYVINRVSKVTKGEPAFWGLVETWWDSEESHAESEQSPLGKSFHDPYFAAHITDGFGAWLEEKQLK